MGWGASVFLMSGPRAIVLVCVLTAALVGVHACTDVNSLASRDTNGTSPTPSGSAGTPVITSFSVGVSGPVLAAIAQVPFQAAAVDPNGKTVTISWSFGDGTSAQGASATHIFAQAGTFTVTVTASSVGGSTSQAQSLVIKDLSGTWDGTYNGGFGARYTLTFVQGGTKLSGEYAGDDLPDAVINQGTITAPRNVAFQVFQQGNGTSTLVSFSGAATASLDEMDGFAWSGASTFQAIRRQTVASAKASFWRLRGPFVESLRKPHSELSVIGGQY